MPKKSRRTKAKHRVKPAKKIRERQPQPVRPEVATLRLQAKTSSETRSLPPRYQYVMPELRYIGILGGSIILILIVLAFVLG